MNIIIGEPRSSERGSLFADVRGKTPVDASVAETTKRHDNGEIATGHDLCQGCSSCSCR